MTEVILHGCNGKMGRMVGDLIAADPEITIVAGVDAFDEGKNPFPEIGRASCRERVSA